MWAWLLPSCVVQERDIESQSMTLLDHLFFFFFAVIYPIAGFIGFRRLVRKIAEGMPVNRSHLYVQTISWQWALFALAMVVWAISDRSWGALGFNFELNYRVLIGAGLTMAGVAFLFAQVRGVATASQEDLQGLQGDIGEMSLLIPLNGSELARFNMLSITAGIVEETLWRGFLIWYLGHVMPIWAAVIISAVGFGLAHSYQGLANVPRVTMVGAVLAGLFLLTGSLWLSMILHGAVDLLQGRLAYELLRRINKRRKVRYSDSEIANRTMH